MQKRFPFSWVRKIYSWKLGEKGKEILSLPSEKVCAQFAPAAAAQGESHSPASRVAAKERRRADGIAMWLRERGSGGLCGGGRSRRHVAEGLLRVPLLPSLPFAAARCTACSPQSG